MHPFHYDLCSFFFNMNKQVHVGDEGCLLLGRMLPLTAALPEYFFASVCGRPRPYAFDFSLCYAFAFM